MEGVAERGNVMFNIEMPHDLVECTFYGRELCIVSLCNAIMVTMFHPALTYYVAGQVNK